MTKASIYQLIFAIAWRMTGERENDGAGRPPGTLYALFTCGKRGGGHWWCNRSTQLYRVPAGREPHARSKCCHVTRSWSLIYSPSLHECKLIVFHCPMGPGIMSLFFSMMTVPAVSGIPTPICCLKSFCTFSWVQLNMWRRNIHAFWKEQVFV